MASKSLLVLTIMLFCVSSFLSVRGQGLPEHLHGEHKFERGLQSNNSAGSTTTQASLKEAASGGYTHVAGFQSKGVYGNTWWHGVRAKITVWKIQDVQPLSESSAYIAAINDFNGQEMVVAGVHVYPLMHNNSDLRFFTYWKTTKNGLKGCYNDFCPGFVIANGSNLLPGQALSPLSSYGGEMRYITLRIKKDEKTGDWSLYREDQGGPIGGMTLLGWWPQSLFNSLSDRANVIQWLGEVNYQYNETGPSMGSGHFPSKHEGEAASFNDCFGFDYDGTIYRRFYKPIPFVDRPECYTISPWYDTGKPEYQHFFYGGPGGCSK